jgi:hypothetical protein
VPSRIRKFSSDSLDERVEKGHGQGEGVSYKPWFFISEIPSTRTSPTVDQDSAQIDRHAPSKNEPDRTDAEL